MHEDSEDYNTGNFPIISITSRPDTLHVPRADVVCSSCVAAVVVFVIVLNVINYLKGVGGRS